MAAYRAVALPRRPSVPAIKEMVREMEGRERRKADQNNDPRNFKRIHQNAPVSLSIRSILKMTGLVPSLQQAIMTRSSLVQPRMIAPPCSAA